MPGNYIQIGGQKKAVTWNESRVTRDDQGRFAKHDSLPTQPKLPVSSMRRTSGGLSTKPQLKTNSMTRTRSPLSVKPTMPTSSLPRRSKPVPLKPSLPTSNLRRTSSGLRTNNFK
jgi:hypothetical protein